MNQANDELGDFVKATSSPTCMKKEEQKINEKQRGKIYCNKSPENHFLVTTVLSNVEEMPHKHKAEKQQSHPILRDMCPIV